MLADHDRKLLTAYVDGELTSRQRKLVVRLLRRSPEARDLLRKLQEDAAALRHLPRPRLGLDFPRQVFQAIARLPAHPVRQRLAPEALPGVLTWSGWAAAALVLFAVGVGSYHYFAPDVADQVAQTANPARSLDSTEKRGADSKTDNSGTVHPDKAQPDNPAESMPAPLVAERDPLPSSPSPEIINAVALPDPRLEVFPAVVDPLKFAIFKPRELEADKLRAEFQKDTGFRLELPCRESVTAFRRLQTAFEGTNIELLIEPVAQQRMKQPKLKTHFVVYAEDLTREELVRVLVRLGNEDKKAAEAKPRGNAVFDGLVITPMTNTDRTELSKLLGIDVKHLAAPKLGEAPRSEPVKAGVKSPKLLALGLPYNPIPPQLNSPEVKRFVASCTKQPPRAGTVQVLLVLREH